MTSLERRWCDALLSAVLPRTEKLPGIAAVPLDTFWVQFRSAAPFLVRFGFRFSVLALCLLPLLRYGRTFPQLGALQQDAYLRWLLTSRSYALRQLITVVKLIGCFAYFQNPQVQSIVRGAP
jgi:hypothetical protein